MWDQLSNPWQASIEMAWEAYCAGTIPIGAVVADREGCIVSRGRNHVSEPHAIGPRHIAGLPLAHAELDALLGLDYNAVNPRMFTLYTTTEPCPLCAGATVMANIRHVCFASRDPWAGSSDLLGANTNAYIRHKSIVVEGPTDPLLETILIAIQAEFFLRDAIRRARTVDPLTSAFALRNSVSAYNPLGASLGETFFADHTLTTMRDRGLSAGEMIDAVAAIVMMTGRTTVSA